jgi:hypothetical protein
VKKLLDWIKQVETVKLGEISRDITLYTNSKAACPVCSEANDYDATADASYNIVCAVCKGAYWVITQVANLVPARVHWTNDEFVTATPGGKYYVGEVHAKIDAAYLSLAQACQSFDSRVTVDGQEMTISRIVPLGTIEILQYQLILKGAGSK